MNSLCAGKHELVVEAFPEALLVQPHETFEITGVLKSGLAEPSQQGPLWLKLELLTAEGTPETLDGPSSSWKEAKDGRATWSLHLEREGDFRALLKARSTCAILQQQGLEYSQNPCFVSLPLRQENDVSVKVAKVYARLEISWKQSQIVEAMSDLGASPQGVLQVSPWSLDGSNILREFRSPVNLVAIEAGGAQHPLREQLLRGTTRAKVVNGVAAFPGLRLSHPGTYKLVAFADGAQATETPPIFVSPASSRFLRCVISSAKLHEWKIVLNLCTFKNGARTIVMLCLQMPSTVFLLPVIGCLPRIR